MDPPETIGTQPPNSLSRREFLTQTRSLGIAAAALPRLHTGGLSQPLPRLKSRTSPWRPPRLPRRQRRHPLLVPARRRTTTCFNRRNNMASARALGSPCTYSDFTEANPSLSF